MGDIDDQEKTSGHQALRSDRREEKFLWLEICLPFSMCLGIVCTCSVLQLAQLTYNTFDEFVEYSEITHVSDALYRIHPIVCGNEEWSRYLEFVELWSIC